MNKFILLSFLFFLSACDLNDEIMAISSTSDQERVWVFAQFNVEEEKGEIETYYYYGQIAKSAWGLIKDNTISTGFIFLNNVRYWGTDDLIYAYEDLENTGEVVFRIENIVRIKRVKNEPIIGQSYDQYEEKSVLTDDKPAVDEVHEQEPVVDEQVISEPAAK